MSRHRMLFAAAGLLVQSCLFAHHLSAQDWSAVDAALGRHGASLPGGVEKYGFPRGDLHVTIDGVALRPALALGSWVAFKRTSPTRAMVMGDLVLTEDEIAPVMQALRSAGMQQTALHNHLLHESPRVMYMHVMGEGDPAALARAIHDALAKSATPIGTPPQVTPIRLLLDTAAVTAIIGAHGTAAGGVYQIGVPRPDTIRDHGVVIPPAMGVATGINIQPTTGDSVVATGDFVLLPNEVDKVIQALSANGIAMTALHSHLLSEQPHVLFMHFWASGPATSVARGLRAALNATAMGAGLHRQ